LLAHWALIDRPGSSPGDKSAGRPSFVDGMGQWLGWADAIALSAALNAPLDQPATEPDAASGSRHRPALSSEAAARREFDRVRNGLLGAIEDTPTDTDFTPHRRRYRALQQSMEAGIGPLRALLRDALARRSPDRARLAALDAVMDEALREREQAVLSGMPSLLQQHFERLLAGRRASDPVPAGVPGDTAPDPSPAPGQWLVEFRGDMQRMLRAELDLRLQPAHGLLEALHSAATRVS
jgi:hypothetical protein